MEISALKRKTPILAAALACLLSSSLAQATSLVDVYRHALASDPDLRAASATRSAGYEVEPQARAMSLPNVNASLSQGQDFAVDTPRGGDSAYGTHNYSVSVTQPLYYEEASVRQRQAQSQVKQADVQYSSAEQGLVLRVASAYFDVLAAEDDLTYATKNKEAISRQLEQAKRRFEVGLITITDVQEAQARYDQTTASEIEAQKNLADRYEALRQLTGQRYQNLDGLSDKLPLEAVKPADVEAWVSQALEHNPEVHNAALAVEVAREQVNYQRAGHLPKVNLNADYSHYDQSNSGDSSGASVGIQVSIPIYQGGAIDSQTRQAAYQHEAAKEALESLQRSTIREVQNTYRGIESAISQIKALDQVRTSSRSALEATQAGYEVGTRTIVEVLDAERAVLQADRDFRKARYGYVLSKLTLNQLAGKLNESDLQEVAHHLAGEKPAKPAAPVKAKADKK